MKTLKALFASSLLAVSLATAPASFAQTETQLSDAFVEGKLISTFTLNDQLSPFDIDVESENGVVTLTGTVESEVERDLAVELAKSLEEVTQVNDQLQIEPDLQQDESRSAFATTVRNATTTAKIKSQLLWNSETDGLDIQINTRDGHVTLDGSVDSESELALAESIARNTKGVKSVRNNLVIKPDSDQSLIDKTSEAAKETVAVVKETAEDVGVVAKDTWITTKIKSLLVFDRRFEGVDVDIETKNGEVTLSGTIPALTEQQDLISAVQQVKGVKEVNAELQVAK